ncbi:MAG: hypothetical protein ABFS28_06200 [Bacteroidota bacterium]
MKQKYRWIIMWIVAGLMVSACSPGERYERRLDRELASGIRHDSLFMGIYFGMTDKDFYTHCWNLNRKGVIRQGTSNLSVEYQVEEELKHPATMNFYPVFGQGRIVEMPVRFIYNGWAPWNKEYSAESLSLDVLNWYQKIYGNGFIKVTHPERGKAFTKIDGNRRITIYTENDMHVWAVFTDMLAEGISADEETTKNIAQ